MFFFLSKRDSSASAVTAVEPSIWYVGMMVCEKVHMNTIIAKQPYGDELRGQMEK